jgi:hypothetical protein
MIDEIETTPKQRLEDVITDYWFSDGMADVGPDELRQILTELADELPETYRDTFDEDSQAD